MSSPIAPLRIAFVMEQVLGHATHYRNMREYVDKQSSVEPVWLPIPFDANGAARMIPVMRNNWSVRASWRARQALSRVRGSINAAIFHTQVTSLFSIGLMQRVPSIISMDATPINYDSLGEHYGHRPASQGRRFLERQKYELNRRAFHTAAGLVTWSGWARRSLIADYAVDPRRIRVINPGAASRYFDIGRDRAKGEPASLTRRVRLLFVGGDFERKGGPELLEVMKGPLGEICELHAVTNAPLRPQPHVTVHTGLTPNSQQLLNLFAQADIFTMPTRAECLGVALMEAAAAALPVVSTRDGAQSETVEADESGLLVRTGDVQQLHAAIDALVRDPERRHRMGRAAFTLANQKFNADRNNRAVVDFARELVDTRHAARRAA